MDMRIICTMLEEDLQALRVFEQRVLRLILSGVKEDGVWRRSMSHKLAEFYGGQGMLREYRTLKS